MTYEVTDITFNASDLEQLGTKEKFWFLFSPDDELKWLFKFSRENTGEHWAEKVAEQLCQLLGIPHAKYEIARCNGRFGVITPNLVPQDQRMVMGNEVLHNYSPKNYPEPEVNESHVRVKEHTVSRVLGCIDSKTLPPDTSFDLNGLNAGDVFCGYLLLDALISNQDRHHENWAILVSNTDGNNYLSPTYDHAASLGRELQDAECKERINTKDKGRMISAFVRRARSELFNLKGDKKPLHTVEAFFLSVAKREDAKKFWLNKLIALDDEKILSVFDAIPNDIISNNARQFALEMVLNNKTRILNDERA